MRRTAHLLFASTLLLAACGPAAQPSPPTSAPAPAAKPTEAPKPAAAAAPTTAAAKPAAATGARGRGDMLKILYWQAPTILNSHLAQGTKDYDAARLVLEPLASTGPDGKPIANL